MRVIAGTLRSRPLTAPPGLQTRPTTDRLRETLFNILTQGATDRVAGHHFLDPPYDSTEYDLALTLLGNECATLLAPNALVIAEHRKKSPLPKQFGQLQRIRLLHQGDAALSFYQLAPN